MFTLRIEDANRISLVTTRTINSVLWFVNNGELLEQILGIVAKFQAKYRVEIYAIEIMGNHYHIVCRFPYCNRARFFQQVNSQIAMHLGYYVPEFSGKLWAKRYSEQELPNEEDVEHYVEYTLLNPVYTGLAKSMDEYPGCNLIDDVINGKRECKYFNWGKFNQDKKKNKLLDKEHYIESHTLIFTRLPKYNDVDIDTYRERFKGKLLARIDDLTKDPSKTFATPEILKSIKPGSLPHFTKKDSTKVPIVLTFCSETKARCVATYNRLLTLYKQISKLYLKGNFNIAFPTGTYRPLILEPYFPPV